MAAASDPDERAEPIFELPNALPDGHPDEEVDAWLDRIGDMIGHQLTKFAPANSYDADLLDAAMASLAFDPQQMDPAPPVFVLWLACPGQTHRTRTGIWWHHPPGGELDVFPTRYIQDNHLAPIRATVGDRDAFAFWVDRMEQLPLPETPDALASLLRDRIIGLQWAPDPGRDVAREVTFACPYCVTDRKPATQYRWRVDNRNLLYVLARLSGPIMASHTQPGDPHAAYSSKPRMHMLNELRTFPAAEFAKVVQDPRRFRT